MVKPVKLNPTWNDVKTKLINFNHVGMIALVQDIYALNKENQAFLHARFRLGEDALKPYKNVISRWLWPDVSRNQEISISKAKKAIADYKKAVGQVEDLAELMTYYCEQAVGFATESFPYEGSYYDSLVRMYAQTLQITIRLTPSLRAAILRRLDAIRMKSERLAYGVREEMTCLIAEYQADAPDE